jgi:hypothetical protein
MEPKDFDFLLNVSSGLEKPVILVRNQVTGLWEAFCYVQWREARRGVNDFNELTGVNITQFIENNFTFMQDHRFNVILFKQTIERFPMTTIKFNHQEWLWLKKDKDLFN